MIGGNGGNAAAHAIAKECREQGVICNVVGVPKSIDNDIQLVRRGGPGQGSTWPKLLVGALAQACGRGWMVSASVFCADGAALCSPAPSGPQLCSARHRRCLAAGTQASLHGLSRETLHAAQPHTGPFAPAQIDRCFGFDTAVEEAQRSLISARVEARSSGGISVVKLMGRQSGFIAMNASMASGGVRTRPGQGTGRRVRHAGNGQTEGLLPHDGPACAVAGRKLLPLLCRPARLPPCPCENMTDCRGVTHMCPTHPEGRA